MDLNAKEFVLQFQNMKNDKEFLELLPHLVVIVCLDLYRDTGNFTAITFAYNICRKSKITPPEDLLLLMDKHLEAFIYAKNKDDGLGALGFDSNKKGGRWQGALFPYQLIKKLIFINVDLILSIEPKTKKSEIFAFLAEYTQKVTNSKAYLSVANIKRMFNERS